MFYLDRGAEFQGACKELFKKRHIVYRPKYGKNKAFLSESYIRIVKRRLYMALRGTLNQNWVKLLEIVVKNLNNIPNEKLGFLKPNMIQNEAGSVAVSNAKNELNLKTFREPNFQQQEKNQSNYENLKSEFQAGDFCYVDFDEKLFDKSFDVVVCILKFRYIKFLQNS